MSVIDPDVDSVLEQTAGSNEHAPGGAVSSNPEGDSSLGTTLEGLSLVRQRGQPFYNTIPTLTPTYQSTFQHAASEVEITVPADSRFPDYGTDEFTRTLPEETVWDSSSQYYFKEVGGDHARLEVYRIILRGAKHNGSSYTWEELLCYQKDLDNPGDAFTDGDLTIPPLFKIGEAEVPRHLWADDMAGFSTATCPITLDPGKLYQSLHHIKVRHLAKMRRNSTGGVFDGVADGDAGSLTTGELMDEDANVEGAGFFGCIVSPVTAYSIERGTGTPAAPLTEAAFVAAYGPHGALESPGYDPVPANLYDSLAHCHASISGYAAPILFIPIMAGYPGRAPFSPPIDPYPYGDLATKRNFPIAGGASAFSDLPAWRDIATGAPYNFASSLPCELVPAGVPHDVYLDLVRYKVQKWKKTYYPWGYRYNYAQLYPWDPAPDPTFYWYRHDGYVDNPQNGETVVEDELISEEWHDIICPHLVWAPFED